MSALPDRVAEPARLPGVWRGGELEAAPRVVHPTGHAALDQELPGGGWPEGVLTEVLHDGEGLGEVSFLARAMVSAAREDRLVAWVSPPRLPYAPALAQSGLALDRSLVVRPLTHEDALWAAEQALRSGACGALAFWPERLAKSVDYAWLRRLQMAAEAGRALAVLFRSTAALPLSTPAHLRVALFARDGAVSARIVKRRGPPLAAPIALRAPFERSGCAFTPQAGGACADRARLLVPGPGHPVPAPEPAIRSHASRPATPA